MSKHKKMPRGTSPSDKTPSGKTPSDKTPSGRNRNGLGKKELKETIAAEAIVAAKKAEMAPAAAPRPTAKQAEPAPEASPRPAAKAPVKLAAKPAVKTPAPPAVHKRAPAATASPPERPNDALAGAAETFERSFKEARQGTIAVNRKLIDFARVNLNSSLDHARDLAAARSPVRIMRLQMEYWHDCLETFASQAQELRALSAEFLARANEPIRRHIRSRPARTAS